MVGKGKVSVSEIKEMCDLGYGKPRSNYVLYYPDKKVKPNYRYIDIVNGFWVCAIRFVNYVCWEPAEPKDLESGNYIGLVNPSVSDNKYFSGKLLNQSENTYLNPLGLYSVSAYIGKHDLENIADFYKDKNSHRPIVAIDANEARDVLGLDN